MKSKENRMKLATCKPIKATKDLHRDKHIVTGYHDNKSFIKLSSFVLLFSHFPGLIQMP